MTEDVFDPPRPLTQQENDLLRFLLATSDFAGADALREQSLQVRVSRVIHNGNLFIDLEVPSEAPRANVVARIPVEAYEKGHEFGPTVHVLVHVVNGILSYIECYNDIGATVNRLPRPDELSLFVF